MRPALEAVGRALKWVFDLMPGAGPVQIALWLVVGGLTLLLFVVMIRRARAEGWLRRKHAKDEDSDDWQPDPEKARQWIERADTLAAQGRFAEAIHSLLLHSIDDLAALRPQLDRPSLTGRELAASPLIPPRARSLFGSIVAKVEPSWFGGRPVSEVQWSEARTAYNEFAMAPAWSVER